MAVKVGINGFGRIGRNIMRAAMGDSDIDIVAVNDLTNASTLAHLLKYDSILGNLDEDVKAEGDTIHVAGRAIKVLATKNPADLPWKSLGVEYVIESTGLFTDADKAKAHIDAGARKVIISAPAKGEDLDRAAGHLDAVALGRHVFLEVSEDRVVLQQVGEGLRVRDVVHGDEVDLLVVQRGAQDVAADPAEAVDAHADCHRRPPSCVKTREKQLARERSESIRASLRGSTRYDARPKPRMNPQAIPHVTASQRAMAGCE